MIVSNPLSCPRIRFSFWRMIRYSLLVLIHSSNKFFHWARGASARERTTGRGKSSLALGSPLSLRFSPSRSLFPYPLLSNGVSPMLDMSRCLISKLAAALRYNLYQTSGLRPKGVKESGKGSAREKPKGDRGNVSSRTFPLSSLGCSLAFAPRAQ